ncbi:MAG: hypothetical protein ACF8MF_08435 [Phycisphaerales bacterium JB052]
MNPTQAHLLRSLASGVRPVDLGEPMLGGDDRFSGMLESAIEGHPRSEVGVTLGPSISGMFDLHQQELISRAVDIAAASGSENALILHDTHAMRVDVRNRVVSDAPELLSDQIITGIDSFVLTQVPENEEETDDVVPPKLGVVLPARVVRNASLVSTLAQAGEAHQQ